MAVAGAVGASMGFCWRPLHGRELVDLSRSGCGGGGRGVVAIVVSLVQAAHNPNRRYGEHPDCQRGDQDPGEGALLLRGASSAIGCRGWDLRRRRFHLARVAPWGHTRRREPPRAARSSRPIPANQARSGVMA